MMHTIEHGAEHERRPRGQKLLPGEDGAGIHWIGTAIAAGSSLVGGLLGGSAAEDAADAQARAYREALDLQREQYQQAREDVAPWRRVGGRAISTLDREIDPLTRPFALEDFEATPGYQFRLGEGEKAINRAAAARRMFESPATVKELQRFGQGLASDEFARSYDRYNLNQANRFNRLAALSGVGQTAASQTANMGMNFGQMGANTLIGGGNAAAAGLLNAANARISGLTGAGSAVADQMNANRLYQILGSSGGFGGGRF